MSGAPINYLFPPQKINELETWRFLLHFIAPPAFGERELNQVISALKETDFFVVEILDIDKLEYDAESNSVSIPVEVSREKRLQIGALQHYESDFWKIMGNMIGFGFTELFYEAVDWKE